MQEIINNRKEDIKNYDKYLKSIINLAKEMGAKNKNNYPTTINTKGKQALYDNLNSYEPIVNALHNEIMQNKPDKWLDNHSKQQKVKKHINDILEKFNMQNNINLDIIFDIICNQHEYK